MSEKTKSSGFKNRIRTFLSGFQLISSIAMGVFVIGLMYVSYKYFNFEKYTPEQVAQAQKIGNWEFPDASYYLANMENIFIDNKDIGVVAIKDKKNGNVVMVFSVDFSQTEILRQKDSIQKQLLERYDLEKSYLKSSGNKIGRFGEEFVYSTVGWGSGAAAKSGFTGSLDCLKNNDIGSSILAIAYSESAKYNEARALAFVSTLKCPFDIGNPGGDINIGDKADIDNDGLTDKVEKMLKSDPYKKDTDDDGVNDFEELQTGHSPLLPRPWDTYTPEDFIKVKKDIKYVSVDVYDKLFPAK